MCSASLYIIIFILAIELVGTTKRVFTCILVSFLYTLGPILMGFLAMHITHFRTFLRIIFGPTFFIIAYISLFPESVRWLLAKRKFDEVRVLLERAAKINNVQLSETTTRNMFRKCQLSRLLNAKKKNYPMLNALKSRSMFVRLIINCVCCFIISFIYFGLNIHAVSIGGDKHLNYTVMNFSELPASIVSYFIMENIKRKMSLSSSMIATSLACLVYTLIPEDSHILLLILLFIAKFCISILFTIYYFYITEIFPTDLRQSCINLIELFGAFGVMIAPQILLLV